MCSFNSLFEMLHKRDKVLDGQPAGFNSLFEMHYGAGVLGGAGAEAVSILYLRCPEFAAAMAKVLNIVFQFSI